MALHRHGNDFLPRDSIDLVVVRSLSPSPHERDEYGTKMRRGRRFGRISKRKLTFWMFLLLTLLSLIYLFVFGAKLSFHLGKLEIGVLPARDESVLSTRDESVLSTRDEGLHDFDSEGVTPRPPKHRKQHFPCEVAFLDSFNDVVEPKDPMNFSRFSLRYIDKEEIPRDTFEPRFGGHQTLAERENSFYARNQTIHCGFIKGPEGSPSTGFDVEEKDKEYMNTCRVVVSSCIFGSSDFLRRPTSKKISEYSKKNVCFIMFLDEQTLSTLSSDGHDRDDRGYMGLWRIVVVRNLPYMDMRRTGKVPKFLSHRLFPSARYSIWLDSKMRLQTDPMLILEYFLWRKSSEFSISNHYDRHCVWEEVLQNKRLNKYDHTAIDEQFHFYQSDGLTKFDPSDPDTPLPSYVPEGSFIVRAHTPMSNLFSCLWFNEVDRFTSRDQLSFAYTYLKLRRMNPDKPLVLNMFKDCERRAVAKLFRHREVESLPKVP